jgi:hypothetical protein
MAPSNNTTAQAIKGLAPIRLERNITTAKLFSKKKKYLCYGVILSSNNLFFVNLHKIHDGAEPSIFEIGDKGITILYIREYEYHKPNIFYIYIKLTIWGLLGKT